MKKWLYFLSVGGMTALFLVFYLSSLRESEARDKARALEAKQKQEQAEAKKKDDEARARVDAEKRAAERAKELADKEAEKRRKWDEEGKRILDETNANLARGDKTAKQAAALEIELDTLRKNREKLNQEAFNTAKLVERAEVEKQTSEIEIQRFTEQIARRAADSSMTRMPAPVAVSTK